MLRIEHHVHEFLERDRLAHRPDAHVVHRPLALDIGLVDDEMRRLGRGIGVELEAHARMARAHDEVRDEARVVAQMARQAFLGARFGLIGRIHAGGDVLGVGGAGDVHAEPGLGAAVARLAADAVADLELGAAPVGRRVVGVAVEANLRRARVAQAEIAGDALGRVLRPALHRPWRACRGATRLCIRSARPTSLSGAGPRRGRCCRHSSRRRGGPHRKSRALAPPPEPRSPSTAPCRRDIAAASLSSSPAQRSLVPHQAKRADHELQPHRAFGTGWFPRAGLSVILTVRGVTAQEQIAGE